MSSTVHQWEPVKLNDSHSERELQRGWLDTKMTAQSHLRDEIVVLRLIAQFLSRHPYPRKADWLRFAQSQPEARAGIASFARSYGRGGKVDVMEVPDEWLAEPTACRSPS